MTNHGRHGVDWTRGRKSALPAGVMLIAFPVLLVAHLALREGRPAEGARLDEAPSEVLLTFTEGIDLGVSDLLLSGPMGRVELGPLETNDTRTILRATIVGPLMAGDHTVRWQAVGRDGHPVRGEYVFTIEEGAAGLPAPVDEEPVVSGAPAVSAPTLSELPTFDSRSPLYAGARWMTYVGIVGTTGAVGFLLLLLGLSRTAPKGGANDEGIGSAAGLGLLAGLVIVVALPLRLQAQSHALFGAGITGERFSRLLSTPWGLGWSVQAAGAVAALLGFLLARRSPVAGIALAALGALALSISSGLSGHAASVDTLVVPAILSDGLHVLGAGTWIGTLFALVVVGIPMARRRPPQERGPFVFRMISAFSPIALAAAAVVLATGLFASFLHLQAIADLWTTSYGRVLAAKLFLVLLVGAAGAYNWLRVRPRGDQPGVDLHLRRSAGIELTAAALVIALTSVLVAVPPPAGDVPTSAEATVNPSD
ncbi:MAG TPA: CopD family protein [Longimicrobiaceae bacterium]|nr:CopD family protein [Longimicrobiaceae bacterium]